MGEVRGCEDAVAFRQLGTIGGGRPAVLQRKGRGFGAACLGEALGRHLCGVLEGGVGGGMARGLRRI
jgi:hypothetical protein